MKGEYAILIGTRNPSFIFYSPIMSLPFTHSHIPHSFMHYYIPAHKIIDMSINTPDLTT